ncbi:MAG: DUF6455 family protein [Arenicellales bacterium]
MSTIESIIIIFFLFLAVFVLIGLFRSIKHSSQQGETFYQSLISRIKHLRMHKMLQALGIDTGNYARGHQVTEIEMHMKRCRECSSTKQCDAELSSGETINAEEYCPNNKDLLNTPVEH